MTFALLRTWQEVPEEILRQSHTTYSFCHPLSTLWNQQQKDFCKALVALDTFFSIRTFPIGWSQPVTNSPEEYWEETCSVCLHLWLSRKLFNVSSSHSGCSLRYQWPPSRSSDGSSILWWEEVFLLKEQKKLLTGIYAPSVANCFPPAIGSSVTFLLETEESVFLVLCYLLFGSLGYALFFLHDTVFGWLLLLKLQFLGIYMHLFM